MTRCDGLVRHLFVLLTALATVWLVLGAGAIPVLAAAAGEEAAAGKATAVTARFVRSEWHSLFLDGEKVGYTSHSLYDLSDGGHRLKSNAFLRITRGAPRIGYYRKTTADVDAAFRPRAVTCEVQSGGRTWRVTGRTENGTLQLKRTVEGDTATAAIPVDDDLTFRCWAVPATVMRGTPAGQMRRWLVVDASLGAVLPDPFLVRVLGPHTLPAAGDGPALQGTAVLSGCGAEQILHLVDAKGKVLRRLWQTSPMVAEATSLSEARRLEKPDAIPPAVELPGLSYRGYTSDRLGLTVYVPSIPYATHVVSDSGFVTITDLTDEAYVTVRPVQGPEPPVGAAAREAAGGDDDDEPPVLVGLPVFKEWAGRYSDVTVEPHRVIQPGLSKSMKVLGVDGTARLGCTTFRYRNLLFWGNGLPWFASVMVADRHVGSKPMLAQNVIRSIRTEPPKGRLPIQVLGDIIRSPLYGFQIRLPSQAWVIPRHTGGAPTALEVARTDQSALAVIRFVDRDGDQTLKDYVVKQAALAAKRFGGTPSEPQGVMLGGLPGYQIAYEGNGMLSGRPAGCTAAYVRRRGRVMALMLFVVSDAGEAVAKEMAQLRESLRFLD